MPNPSEALSLALLRVTLAGIVLLLAAGLFLIPVAGVSIALGWAGISLLVWVGVGCFCRYNLDLNRPHPQAPLYPTLGHGNTLSLLRGGLIAAMAGFIIRPPAGDLLVYLPALLYTLAALGDWCDGYVARREGRITGLGEKLDMSLDALGLLVAPVLGVLMGKVPGAYLLVSVAFYLFWWRTHQRVKLGLAVNPLPPSRLRRLTAGFQMGYVATALWPPIDGEVSQAFGLVFMVPVLTGFCLDWMAVTGRYRVPEEQRKTLESMIDRWVSPVSRVALVIMLLWAFRHHPSITVLLQTAEPAEWGWQMAFTAGLGLCLACLLAGVFARGSAIGVMILLGWHFNPSLPSPLAWAIIVLTVVVALFGAGRYTLRRIHDTP